MQRNQNNYPGNAYNQPGQRSYWDTAQPGHGDDGRTVTMAQNRSQTGAPQGAQGYAPQGGYVTQPGGAPQGGYVTQPGGAPQGGYVTQPGGAPQGGYVTQPGGAPQGGGFSTQPLRMHNTAPRGDEVTQGMPQNRGYASQQPTVAQQDPYSPPQNYANQVHVNGTGTATIPLNRMQFNQQPPQDSQITGQENMMPPQPGASMKTTDVIRVFMKSFGKDSAPVAKMIEKVQAVDRANGEIKAQQREIKRRNRNIITICSIAGVILIGIVLTVVFGINYRSNKKDENHIYKYLYGIPIKEVLPDEDIDAWFLVEGSDKIYFAKHTTTGADDDLELYSVDKNGKNLKCICTDTCSYLVEHENYIYYINSSNLENPMLCRIDKNKTEASGEIIYEDDKYPIFADNGLGFSGNMIKFSVYNKETNADVEPKFYDADTGHFYSEKKD